MNKVIKKMICIAICFLSVISFVSCDDIYDILYPNKKSYVPEGYTGGIEYDDHFHGVYEIKWVETYEEMMDAVTLLRSHGSTIYDTTVFNCEEDGLDVKFCFTSRRDKAPALQDGENYFDRCIDGVSITQYIFLEDVTIEELEYSMWEGYEAMCVRKSSLYDKPDDLPALENIEFVRWIAEDAQNGYGHYEIRYNDRIQILLSMGYEECTLTEKQIDVLKNSLEIHKW